MARCIRYNVIFVRVFLRVFRIPPPIKLTLYNVITETLLKVAFNIIQATLANKIFRKAWVISVWLHFQYCSVLFCQWHCGFRLVFGFLQPIKLTAAIQHSLHGVHHVTNLHLVRGKSVKVNPTVIWLWQRKPLNINIQTIDTSCHYVHCKGHVNKWKFGAFLIKKSWNFYPRIIRLQLGKGGNIWKYKGTACRPPFWFGY